MTGKFKKWLVYIPVNVINKAKTIIGTVIDGYGVPIILGKKERLKVLNKRTLKWLSYI